jgi:hypothetical protein
MPVKKCTNNKNRWGRFHCDRLNAKRGVLEVYHASMGKVGMDYGGDLCLR